MFWALFANFNILGPFGGKMGVVAKLAPLGLGPQNSTKKLAHVGVLLGQLLSQNKVSKMYRLGPPLKLLKVIIVLDYYHSNLCTYKYLCTQQLRY